MLAVLVAVGLPSYGESTQSLSGLLIESSPVQALENTRKMLHEMAKQDHLTGNTAMLDHLVLFSTSPL
jgi:hypothetical protein